MSAEYDVVLTDSAVTVQHEPTQSKLDFVGDTAVLTVGGTFISYKDLAKYDTFHRIGCIEDPQPQEGKQLIEVACGLAGVVPLWAQTEGIAPPIAIDPMNYGVARNLLVEALNSDGLTPTQRDLTKELLNRVDIITNPQKVTLINTPLEQAVLDHPELAGIGDVVIDLAGPVILHEKDSADYLYIQFLEKSYLRKEPLSWFTDQSLIN